MIQRISGVLKGFKDCSKGVPGEFRQSQRTQRISGSFKENPGGFRGYSGAFQWVSVV